MEPKEYKSARLVHPTSAYRRTAVYAVAPRARYLRCDDNGEEVEEYTSYVLASSVDVEGEGVHSYLHPCDFEGHIVGTFLGPARIGRFDPVLTLQAAGYTLED